LKEREGIAMNHDSKLRKCAFILADKHLSELSEGIIIASCPRHYGPDLTDEHKLFMWNGLVDHYLELNEGELWRLFDRHITQKEPIVKLEVWDPLPSDLEDIVSRLVDCIWKTHETVNEEPPKQQPRQLRISENTD